MQIHMYHSDLYSSYHPIDTQGNTCRFTCITVTYIHLITQSTLRGNTCRYTCITVTYIHLITQSTPKEIHVDSHVSQWPIFILSPNRHPRKYMQIHMYHSDLYSSYHPIDTQGNACRYTCITVAYIHLINQSTPKEIHVDSHVSQ